MALTAFTRGAGVKKKKGLKMRWGIRRRKFGLIADNARTHH
jgi:hypothetical protein